ncbi:MAG TPA: hypothetical protein VIL86_03585 [Tepidisphaeraceae bacterium]|jgi:rubredoxin
MQNDTPIIAPDTKIDYRPRGKCANCGYLLRGLTSSRCPECGQDFDPYNPATMKGILPRTHTWFWPSRLREKDLISLAGFSFLFIFASESGISRGIDEYMNLGLIGWTLTLLWILARFRLPNGNRILAPRTRGVTVLITCFFALCLALFVQHDKCPHGTYWKFGPTEITIGQGCGNERHFTPLILWWTRNPVDR